MDSLVKAIVDRILADVVVALDNEDLETEGLARFAIRGPPK